MIQPTLHDHRSIRLGSIGAGLIGALAAFAVHSQAPTHSAETNRPDVSGIWAPVTCLPNGVCPWFGALQLNEAAAAIEASWDETLSPKYDCVPATTPGIVSDPYLFRIEQLEDRVLIHYEKDDVVRTVWMDGRAHPRFGTTFFWQGHSTGWYENDRLVVETTSFLPDPVGMDDFRGLPSSARKHVIERYWREGDRLHVQVTTEDPTYLTGAANFRFEWEDAGDLEMLPYDCDPEQARQPLRHAPEQRRHPVTGEILP